MNALLLGLYGIYLIAAGVSGNGGAVAEQLKIDVKGYAPWVIAIIVLAIIAKSETGAKIVGPFLALLALNYFLMNFDTIREELTKVSGVQL